MKTETGNTPCRALIAAAVQDGLFLLAASLRPPRLSNDSLSGRTIR